LNELDYFNTPEGKFELQYSQQILFSKGNVNAQNLLKQMKALPKTTPEGKEFRSKMISSVKDFKIAEKTLASEKYKSAESFDTSIFTELFNTSDRLAIEIGEIQKKIKVAKENKENFDSLKEQINSLRKEQKVNEAKIKQAKKKNVLHHRANKPTLDAEKCIARHESYKNYVNMFV
jgi:hypothetical protein